MYIVVGRFKFRSMGQEERQGMYQAWEKDFTPLVRARPGFRSVQFIQLTADEVMTVWQWDSAADWEAAQAPFGPFLQQQVGPHLVQPPERATGEVVLEITP